MALTKHLQEELEKRIPKNKWFTKDDVMLIPRTGWVLSRLVEEGILKIWLSNNETRYYCSTKPKK